MKDLGLLAWLTQLGLSVAIPMVIFVFAAIYLQSKFNLGSWVIVVGVVIGFICAIRGFIYSLKTLDQVANRKKNKDIPPVSFNDHD